MREELKGFVGAKRSDGRESLGVVEEAPECKERNSWRGRGVNSYMNSVNDTRVGDDKRLSGLKLCYLGIG